MAARSITGNICTVKRLKNSGMGNARFELTILLDDGFTWATVQTKANSACADDVKAQQAAMGANDCGPLSTFGLTRSGRVETITKV